MARFQYRQGQMVVHDNAGIISTLCLSDNVFSAKHPHIQLGITNVGAVSANVLWWAMRMSPTCPPAPMPALPVHLPGWPVGWRYYVGHCLLVHGLDKAAAEHLHALWRGCCLMSAYWHAKDSPWYAAWAVHPALAETLRVMVDSSRGGTEESVARSRASLTVVYSASATGRVTRAPGLLPKEAYVSFPLAPGRMQREMAAR